MKIVSASILLVVLVSSSDKLLTFAENSSEFSRRSLSSGKCLVDNPSNAGRPLCFIDGEQVDVCSNKGCGGCCGSQCSWIGTYCNEADGVVAKCPGGYTQVGTLSENNDIGGPGLGQSHQDSIADCKNLCESNPKCVAFMYGGFTTEGDSTLCELSETVTPNNGWGSNLRFCRKTVQCLQENPENSNRPLCFLNEVHHDTCSNKGCNGCCGSKCSWMNTYCSDKVVAECPSGYQQIGTLSTNNDVRGAGLGQSQQETIEDCQALCESTKGCVAFMYGGASTVHDSKLCELSSTATPDNNWGSNLRFCLMETTTPPTYLSVSDFELVTDATSCEAVGLETITTTSQCAAAISALELADKLVASDITVSDYYDRKDGCIWHEKYSEATLFSGSTQQDKPCNYQGYAGCVCATPKYMLVDDAISCEAVGLETITTTSQCAAAISALELADNLVASDITVSDYYDRKDGCIWHEKYSEATLFSGSTRQDKPCNYRGYAGCVCAREATTLTTGNEVSCRMTIDNGITEVRYNGEPLEVSGPLNMWTKVNTFSFESVEGAYLEIGGYEFSDCDGCRCSGLLLECDNGFVSNTEAWTAVGSSSSIVGATEGYGAVCESTSGFFLPGQTSEATKIWANGGEKYAWFRAIPVVNQLSQPITVPIGYEHINKGCVHGSNIVLYRQKSVSECAALCDQDDDCVAFEYGVNHGGAQTYYSSRDCQLQSSADYAGCAGKDWNLDLYVKKDDCEPGYKKIVGHPFAGSSCETPGLTCHQNKDLSSQECATACSFTKDCIAYTQEFDHGWCHLMDATYRDGYVADENAFGAEGFYCKKTEMPTIEQTLHFVDQENNMCFQTDIFDTACDGLANTLQSSEDHTVISGPCPNIYKKSHCDSNVRSENDGLTLYLSSVIPTMQCKLDFVHLTFGYACEEPAILEEPAATVETVQFTTSGPGQSCDNACEAIAGDCVEEKLVLQSAEEVTAWALAVGVTCTEIVDRCDIGESPIFNYSIWERKGLCTFCSKPSHPGWLSGNRCRARYQVRERICPCATKIQIEKSEPAQNCDDTCAAVGEECIESKLVLQSVEEVESWASAVGVTCSEIVDRCDIGESPIFNYSIWERKDLCTYCSKTSHPGWLNGKRCGARWHHRERMCPCTSTLQQ